MNVHPEAWARIRDAAAEVSSILRDDPDEVARWDSICAISDADTLAQRLLEEIEEADGDVAKLDAQLAARRDRKTRAARRKDAARRMLAALMAASGVSRIKLADVTASLSRGPEVLQLAADFECPTDFLRPAPPPPPREPDTDALLRCAKAGERIPGVAVVRAPDRLSVRRG